MKLRNKKTGEVVEPFEGGPIDLYFYLNGHKGGNEFDRKTYNSLSELNDEWEDYGPKEPLIKDEKIRKAVRAWAEANNIRAVYYSPEEDGFYVKNFDDSDFEKAEKVNSNTQLYKQAGNSIVVNVLEGILKNLLGGE